DFVALDRVLSDQPVVILRTQLIESSGDSRLKRGRRTHVDQIVQGSDQRRPSLAACAPADPPTRDTECLGSSRNSHRPLVHREQTGRAYVLAAAGENMLAVIVGCCEHVT